MAVFLFQDDSEDDDKLSPNSTPKKNTRASICISRDDEDNPGTKEVTGILTPVVLMEGALQKVMVFLAPVVLAQNVQEAQVVQMKSALQDIMEQAFLIRTTTLLI